MKCIICKQFSLKLICKNCQKTFLRPSRSIRTLPDGFKIYSFYAYKDIEDLIKTKHTHIGSAIYSILAKNAFFEFAKEFTFSSQIYAISIDDHVKSGYSHTAILANSLKSKNIKPVFNKLRAKNSVSYSGESLSFRLQNIRDFEYSFKSNIDAILVDDIVTTTTTINEAKNTLIKSKVNPLFALTLADAREQ